VLDLLLTDGTYLAKRDGSLIVLRPVAPGEALPPASTVAALPALPAVPALPVLPSMVDMPEPPEMAEMPEPPEPPEMAEMPEPPEPPDALDDEHHGRGSDREVFGGNLRIEKGEIVNDVSVFGGNVDVWGTVTGDLVVTGGSVRVHEGARVKGDVTTMGGTVTIEDHARVDGDVGTVGGVLRRGKNAEIHGDVRMDNREAHKHKAGASDPRPQKVSFLRRTASDVGNAVTSAAVLFMFGAVLLSLATTRMETLKVEVASRPMRTFALGVVAIVGWLGFIIALCITVVGIPLALLALFGGVVALFAGISATLETIGGALLGHKTKNPYVHLAFGCGLFIIFASIPFVGILVRAAVLLTGVGCVAATRGAGFFPAKNKSVGTPYRDASAVM
jgi:cytoskeletal protein CcmA (bactofilin family)